MYEQFELIAILREAPTTWEEVDSLFVEENISPYASPRHALGMFPNGYGFSIIHAHSPGAGIEPVFYPDLFEVAITEASDSSSWELCRTAPGHKEDCIMGGYLDHEEVLEALAEIAYFKRDTSY